MRPNRRRPDFPARAPGPRLSGKRNTRSSSRASDSRRVGSSTVPDLSPALAQVTAILDSLEREFPIDSRRRLRARPVHRRAWRVESRVERAGTLRRSRDAVPRARRPFTRQARLELPIWIFQGDQDGASFVAGSRALVAALKAAGGQPRYTEYRTPVTTSGRASSPSPKSRPGCSPRADNKAGDRIMKTVLPARRESRRSSSPRWPPRRPCRCHSDPDRTSSRSTRRSSSGTAPWRAT